MIKLQVNIISHVTSHISTDDLVIFCKADKKHGRLLKDILNDFCAIFDHRVNSRKTNMFFSKGVEESMASMLSNLLGFQKVQDLGQYLGVPLYHQRVTNCTMHFCGGKDSNEAAKLGCSSFIYCWLGYFSSIGSSFHS